MEKINKKPKRDRVWVVAAGTGGHIFPGLSLVDELKKNNSNLDFLFFGTANRLEAKIIPSTGHRIKYLKSGRIKGSAFFSKYFVSPLLMCVGFFQAFREAYKNKPIFLLGIGGYVSVPVGLVAALMRIPIFLLEPNIKAGAANILLSRFARLAFTTPGSDAMQKLHCKTLDFGNPIRKGISPQQIRPTVKNILVLGGSQGALSLCRTTLFAFANLKLYEHGIFLTLQTGERNLVQAQEWQKELILDPYSSVIPFINDVGEELKKTDLVIARAGAMTVSELTEAVLPTIFVPYPYAADDHQTQNAKLLQSCGAARMVNEKDLDYQKKLELIINELALDKNQFAARQALNSSLKAWSRPEATSKISQAILRSI